jgi:ribokinase
LPAALLEKSISSLPTKLKFWFSPTPTKWECRTAAGVCRPLHESGVESVIMTLGKEGALVTSKNGDTRVPGFIVKAVDTTAAGDTFAGALGCALAEGKDLEEAVLFANAAAALSATKQGAQISMPTRDEVDELVAKGETR